MFLFVNRSFHSKNPLRLSIPERKIANYLVSPVEGVVASVVGAVVASVVGAVVASVVGAVVAWVEGLVSPVGLEVSLSLEALQATMETARARAAQRVINFFIFLVSFRLGSYRCPVRCAILAEIQSKFKEQILESKGMLL